MRAPSDAERLFVEAPDGLFLAIPIPARRFVDLWLPQEGTWRYGWSAESVGDFKLEVVAAPEVVVDAEHAAEAPIQRPTQRLTSRSL